MPITRADRARALDIHLPHACRTRRKRATSPDPLAITCRKCLRSVRWRKTSRSTIRRLTRLLGQVQSTLT